MRRLLIIMLSLIIVAGMAGCESGPKPIEKYDNPVYEPVFADPAVIRHEGVYYAFATEDNGEWKKSDDALENEAGMKCVPMLKSEDLVNWYYQGAAFVGPSRPSWGTIGANVWAPDVVKIGDKFIMYYSLSAWGDPDPGIGIATASHPLGPWVDSGKLFLSSEIGVDNSIDPAVFTGADGKLYMIWGSFRGLFGVELEADGMALKGGLSYAKENKVLVAGIVGPWNGSTYEAPYIIYKDDYYYMFVSSGTCCNGFNSTYNVRVSRSKNPLGPYVDSSGSDMRAANKGSVVVTGSAAFAGPGHNSVALDDAGNYYILYHAFDKSKAEMYATSNRRSLLIDKLEWQEGWPEVPGKAAGENGMIAPVINKSK